MENKRKIVDMFAVTSANKPISGGRCEKWWTVSYSDGMRDNWRNLAKNPEEWFKINGKELRDKTESEVLNEYKLKGFEFGNWLTQSDRYKRFEVFKRSLVQLESIFGSKNIGFDYNIGVAFGARGRKGARAHYEPTTNIINVTKENGAGSLMHEYAHALDYSIGAFFDQNSIFTAISGGHTIEQDQKNTGGQFRAMVKKIINYVRSCESYKNMCKNPYYASNICYWANSTECFARLMEAYVAYTYPKYANSYLVKDISTYETHQHPQYLTQAEVKVISGEIEKLIKEIGLLMNNKCKLKKTKSEATAKSTQTTLFNKQAKSVKKQTKKTSNDILRPASNSIRLGRKKDVTARSFDKNGDLLASFTDDGFTKLEQVLKRLYSYQDYRARRISEFEVVVYDEYANISFARYKIVGDSGYNFVRKY